MTSEAKKIMASASKRYREHYNSNRKGEANILLEIHLKELGIPFVPEMRFCKSRRWRFDYYLWLPKECVGLEIEGGIWIGGRHNRPKGYQNDLEKYREAARLGYKVYRFSTQEVLNGTAREFLQGELDGKQMPVYDQIDNRLKNGKAAQKVQKPGLRRAGSGL